MAPTTTRTAVASPDVDASMASDLAAREVAVEVTRLGAAAVLPVVVAAPRLPTREAAQSTRCEVDHPSLRKRMIEARLIPQGF